MLNFIYSLFIWKAAFRGMWEERNLASAGSFPNWLQWQSRLAESRKLEPCPCLPHVWKETKHLGQLLSRCILGSWWEVGQSGHQLVLIWDTGVADGSLTATSKHWPLHTSLQLQRGHCGPEFCSTIFQLSKVSKSLLAILFSLQKRRLSTLQLIGVWAVDC